MQGRPKILEGLGLRWGALAGKQVRAVGVNISADAPHAGHFLCGQWTLLTNELRDVRNWGTFGIGGRGIGGRSCRNCLTGDSDWLIIRPCRGQPD